MLTRIALSLSAAVVVLLAALATIVVWKKSSAGIDRRVSEVFTSKQSAWLDYSPTNLVPEGDQLAFGFTLMPFVDPILTQTGASRLKAMTAGIYRELDRDRDFRALGSAMPGVYAELLGSQPTSGQAFVYAPKEREPREPHPALVFFHGSGGNFKAYLWVLAALADRLGFVLIAPSGGMGDWRGEQSMDALKSALAAGDQIATIDHRRIHVVGLSNGGRAVTQLGASTASGIKTLTFLSPVFDPEVVSSLDARIPVLVVTGDLDDRVPLTYVEENVRAMKRRSANVELRTIPDADHFLMFSHRHQLIESLAAWLAGK